MVKRRFFKASALVRRCKKCRIIFQTKNKARIKCIKCSPKRD